MVEFLLYKIFIFLWSFYANYKRVKSGRVYRTSPPRVQKKSDIKSVSIGIIHLSVLFLCVLCVLCGLIIPLQPELIWTRTLYVERGRWRFTVALGLVYYIIDFRQLWLVKPAPTEIAIALHLGYIKSCLQILWITILWAIAPVAKPYLRVVLQKEEEGKK